VQFNIVRIGEKQIKFVVDVDEKLPSRLYGDELRIKQILNNLLSNAIKYTMDGMETMLKLRELGYKGAIVALTANALVGNDEMFIQKGFDGFISKPIDVCQLDDVLNKFVRDKHPEETEKRVTETVKFKQSKPINNAMNPKLFKFFCQDAKAAVATLRKTVESGDAKLFTITAHAMKSASANVGEAEASALAAALESAGLSGDMEYIAANIDEFIRTLESLIDKFGGAESGGAAGDNGADDSDIDEDKNYLTEQLRLIKSACDGYDDDAAYAALDRLKEKRWKSSTTESLEKIREALYASSDFEGAGELSMSLIDG